MAQKESRTLKIADFFNDIDPKPTLASCQPAVTMPPAKLGADMRRRDFIAVPGGMRRFATFTVLGPLQYIVPTINFLLGVLAYHEKLDAAEFCGFVLVWIGLVIFTVDNLRSAGAKRALESAPLDLVVPAR